MNNDAPPPYPGNVVYVTPVSGTDTAHYPNYLHRRSIGFGAAQLVIGCLCIILNIVCLGLGSGSVYLDLTIIGFGIWSGVMFIISGAFGIAAGKTKSKCQIVTYMVLCIISACFTLPPLIFGIWGSSVNGGTAAGCMKKKEYTSRYDDYRLSCDIYITIAVLEVALGACGFIASFLFIFGSTLACKAEACCQNSIFSFPKTNKEQMRMAFINNGASNNFQGRQGLQVANCSSNTMPYQHGMVVVTGHQPYLPNMDPSTDAVLEEEVVTDGAQVQYNSYSPCRF